MMIDTIQMFHPDISRNEFISEFTKSDTCRLLYDLKTRLWAEGPNYIIGLYEEEKGITLLPDYI